MKRLLPLLFLLTACATTPATKPTNIFKATGAPTYGAVDLFDTSFGVSPTGITRIARVGGVLEQSTDGAAYTALGGGGGTVTTDSTLVGNGSGGSPLGVNPIAARSPDWCGYVKNYFIQQTGLSPLVVECRCWDFTDTTFPPTGVQAQGFVVGGTGATAGFTNIGGGVIKATGPTSGAGFADWAPAGGGTGWTTIGNLQSKHWMVADRHSVGLTPVSASAVSLGVNSGSTFIGLGFAGAQSHTFYCRGTTACGTVATDTGVAFTVDATGATGYLSEVVGNFDLAHIGYNADLLGSSGAAPTNAEASSNAPNSQGQAYFYNEGAGSGQVIHYDNAAFCTEKQ